MTNQIDLNSSVPAEAVSAETAWQIRQRRRHQQRLDALEEMRVRAGHRPAPAFTAAIRQKQNRLEHSR